MRRTKFDIVVDILCVVCILGTALFLLLIWDTIPAQVPGHYNIAGEVDRMDGKYTVLFPLVMGTVLYIFSTLIEQFPEIWNTGVTITKENRERVYRTLRFMLESIKLETVVFLCYMTVHTVRGENFPILIVAVFLTIFLGTMAGFLVRLFRVR